MSYLYSDSLYFFDLFQFAPKTILVSSIEKNLTTFCLFHANPMSISDQVYNVFNSDGKLLQLEYGLEAVYNSYQIVSLVADSEIIFVSKKVPQQPLQVDTHNSIFKLSEGLYMNLTGLPADIDYIVSRSRELAASTEYSLGCPLTPDIFTKALTEKFQTRIQKSSKRVPAFACNIGGFEKGVPLLYYTDMTSIEFPCYAYVAGEDYQKMLKYLEKHYKCGDKKFAIQLAVTTLLQSTGKDTEANEIQVGVISKDGLQHLSNQEVDKVLQIIAENY